MLSLWIPLTGDIHNQGLSDVKIYGAPTSWQEGKIGKCAKFNGDYKTIYTETTHEFDYTDNFSWACWILPVYSGTSMQYIFSVGRADYGSYGYGAHLASATQINIRYGNAEWGIPCEASKWIHIAFVKRNKNIRIYKNGSVYGSITYGGVTPTYTESVGLTLGCFRCNTASIYPSFCSVNDFRLYDTPLTDRQVREISKGLICHYPLGEVDGKIGGRNLLRQSSLVGEQLICNSIDMMNSVTLMQYEEEGYHIVTPSTGNFNNGIGFRYNDFTSLNIKQGDTITFSCDIKGTSDSHKPNVTIRFQANSSSGVWWGNNAASSNSVYFTSSNDNWKRISVTYTIPSDEWTSKTMWLAIHGSYESNLYVRNLKLEKSSIATPWTPAPEDDASFYDNVIYDTSGYCNNGSVSGDILWDTDTPRYKGAYDFNGTGYIYNDNLNLTTTAFTISFWIKVPSTITHQHFDFATFNGWTSEGIAIYWDTSGQTSSSGAIFGEDSKGDKIHVAVQCKGKLNEWTHFAITWDGTKVYRYSNGIKFSESDFNAVSVYHPRLWLGNSTFGDRTLENSESCMSDFRFYTTALSDSDILELYQSSASVDNGGNLMLAGEVIEE